MKNISLKILPLLVHFSLFTFHFSLASEASSEFQSGSSLYQKQEYDSAAKVFEKLIAENKISTEIYYNLGNCYYKTGNTAKSIIAYERALKLNPDDEDALFNLHVAQLKVVDKIEPVPQIFYKRWIAAVTDFFSTKTWSQLMLALLWITFIMAAVYVLSRTPSGRQLTFIITVVFVFLTLSAWFFSHQSYMQNEVDKTAVVTSASAYVKSSPDEKGNDLFIVHEGTKVDVLDEFSEWKKIRIANGSIGWLKSGEVEQI
jgi:tetratricopeptide (TPR) repeat protein